MELTRASIRDNKEAFEALGYDLPAFDYEKVRAHTVAEPAWLHFGPGNIFRAFQAAALQRLLNEGWADTGLTAASFSPDIVEKVYRPHDNLSVLVTLKADGAIEKMVVGSIMESLITSPAYEEDFARMKEIFRSPSLQMISFTITEKGYGLKDLDGAFLPKVQADIEAGPAAPTMGMSIVTAGLLERYSAGALPIACVSMDNCSHNGDVLKSAVLTIADAWAERGFADEGFTSWLRDESRVSFPWTMIDKITPRPDAAVREMLSSDGIEGLSELIVTSRGTYASLFVNAEECEYLIVEDHFPNGRPALEHAGIMFTDRDTVEKTERMKVCTCLNPLHTALAIYGCLLGFNRICDEMEDPVLRRMVERIGYAEGMPVVTDPGILSPSKFLDEVINLRIPNPFMPDTPQRIATDSSQKIPIRYGETVKSYLASDCHSVDELVIIPLVYAGWLRYLMAVDDEGHAFEPSPDPLLSSLMPRIGVLSLGGIEDAEEVLRPIISDPAVFGLDLYEAGLGDLVLGYFRELAAGKGAVRATLEKYVMNE